MRVFIKNMLASVLFLTSQMAMAGLITWNAPYNVTDSADVLTTGKTVEAINEGGDSVTVNGVEFMSLIRNDEAHYTGAISLTGATSNDESYDALIDTFNHGISNHGEVAYLDVAKSLLTVGQAYAIQVFWADVRKEDARMFSYGDGQGNDVTLNSKGTGLGQYAIGTFEATDDFQVLQIIPEYLSTAHINAYQIREIAQTDYIDINANAKISDVPVTIGSVIAVLGLLSIRRKKQ